VNDAMKVKIPRNVPFSYWMFTVNTSIRHEKNDNSPFEKMYILFYFHSNYRIHATIILLGKNKIKMKKGTNKYVTELHKFGNSKRPKKGEVESCINTLSEQV